MNEKNARKQRKHVMLVSLSAFFVFLFLQASITPNQKPSNQPQNQTTPTPAPDMTISGTVTDENGQPLRTYISVQSGLYEALGNVMSEADGTYSIQVPGRKGYIVNAQEADGRVTYGPDVIPTGYLDQDQAVMYEGNRDLVVDFTLKPAGAIWLKTYDENGNYLFRQDVNNNDWRVGIYPLGQPPTTRPLQYINHQVNTFWGWQTGSNKKSYCLDDPT